MTDPPPQPRYLLLRVDTSQRAGRAVPVRVFDSLDEAVAGAAELRNQPAMTWRPGPADGVWQQIDRTGRGFAIHRIDDAAST